MPTTAPLGTAGARRTGARFTGPLPARRRHTVPFRWPRRLSGQSRPVAAGLSFAAREATSTEDDHDVRCLELADGARDVLVTWGPTVDGAGPDPSAALTMRTEEQLR
jgi:hypothetical protein